MASHRIFQFALVVPDYDEAIAFYTQAMFFRLIEDTALSDSKRWVVIGTQGDDGARILLQKATNDSRRSRIGNQTGGSVFLFLHTDDIVSDYAHLKQHRVEIVREISEETFGKVMVCKDCYGNLWDIIEPNKQL